ncbi:MAG TPA: hypothetical protein VNT99_08655, partial [Methylomirabilota bacterium]|nr:hypothetical protein [Methylomirabilota bacterium]
WCAAMVLFERVSSLIFSTAASAFTQFMTTSYMASALLVPFGLVGWSIGYICRELFSKRILRRRSPQK